MAFCSNCGSKIDETVLFCAVCGASTKASAPQGAQAPPASGGSGQPPVPASPGSGFGGTPSYSAVASTLAVREYIRKRDHGAMVFSLIFYGILVAAAIIVPIVLKYPILDNLIALGIAAVIILFSLILNAHQAARRNAAWDGTLENKRIRVRTDRNSEIHVRHKYYELRFRSSGGRKFKMDVPSATYDLFQVGEPVRKHKGFIVPERLSKAEGSVICLSCSRVADRGQDRCRYCKAPIFH